MADRVQFRIGPVPAHVALAWIANSHRLVDAVRRNRGQLSIEARDELLDLVDTLLDIWASHAESNDPFQWSTETGTDQVVHLVRQWLEIGSLTDEELDRIGCTWAPEWTRPFADALVAGAVEALAAADAEGHELAARLTGP